MRFENQTFANQNITLDYNTFVGGVIRNCTLYYYGGEFSLVGTRLENVKFAMAGPANGALMFLRMVRSVNPTAFGQLMNEAPPPADGPAAMN